MRRRPQERQCTCTDSRRRCLQRRDQVRPEQPGIVVALVERKPRRGPLIRSSGCQPVGSNVVLPNPAGADTSVSADSAPRLRRRSASGELRDRVAAWGPGALSRAVALP
jgi:hypothetical protein